MGTVPKAGQKPFCAVLCLLSFSPLSSPVQRISREFKGWRDSRPPRQNRALVPEPLSGGRVVQAPALGCSLAEE